MKTKQFILSSLVIITMLTYPSLLITYLLSIFNFNLTLFRLLLLFIIIIIAFNTTEKHPTSIFSRNLIAYYNIGIAILFFGLLLNSFGSGTVNLLRSIVLFPLFLMIIKSKEFDLKYFINYYLNVVFVLALLSIIQYFATPFGLVSYRSIDFLDGAVVGFGGIGWVQSEKALSSIARNIGFFTEPTNFAQMLMIPLFLSLNKVIIFKKIKYIVLFLTIGLAFILTFSVANYFGLIFGLIIYFYTKIKNPYFKGKYQSTKKILNFAFLILAIIMVYYLFNLTNEYSYNSESVVGKNTTESSIDRINRILIYFENIKENPFGNWAFRDKYTANAGFVGTVLLGGGFPFLVFWIFFLFYYFKRLIKIASRSQFLLIYAGLIAYIIPMLWDVQFMEAQFLFYLAFFVVILKYDQQGYRFI